MKLMKLMKLIFKLYKYIYKIMKLKPKIDIEIMIKEIKKILKIKIQSYPHQSYTKITTLKRRLL